MSNPKSPIVDDLEDQLTSANNGQIKKDVTAYLDAHLGDYKKRLSAGTSNQAEYDALTALSKGIQSASSFVSTL